MSLTSADARENFLSLPPSPLADNPYLLQQYTYIPPSSFQRRRYAMRYSGYTNVGWNTITWHSKAQCATMVIKRSLNGHETV